MLLKGWLPTFYFNSSVKHFPQHAALYKIAYHFEIVGWCLSHSLAVPAGNTRSSWSSCHAGRSPLSWYLKDRPCKGTLLAALGFLCECSCYTQGHKRLQFPFCGIFRIEHSFQRRDISSCECTCYVLEQFQLSVCKRFTFVPVQVDHSIL